MGETLAETRLEVEAQRAHLQQTADKLRARVKRAIDIPAKVRQNPLLTAALVGGAVFLAAGGPVRIARLVRRRTAPTAPEKAYDMLPGPLKDVVDTVAERVGKAGPKADEARRALAVELMRWRHDPRRDSKKFDKELAKELAEGPPGANRAAWKALEAGAVVLSAALARKAVERFLSGDEQPAPPVPHPALDVVGAATGAGEKDGNRGKAADRGRR